MKRNIKKFYRRNKKEIRSTLKTLFIGIIAITLLLTVLSITGNMEQKDCELSEGRICIH